MFTLEQMDEIKNAAKRTKNQGELAVYRYLLDSNPSDATRFSLVQWSIIKYCAEECKRQRSGEISVYDMVNAWNEAQQTWALSHMEPKWNITIQFIERIGQLVEPDDNRKGFRTIPIGVSDGFNWIEKARWDRVPELLEVLLYSYYQGLLFDQEARDNGWVDERDIKFKAKNAEDMFYYHYEEIHPFVDGNGRSGKILYNYLNGTLENPIMPPNFWEISNP